jgi:putative nucleotidyltransferase with HDIG domain
VLRALCSGTAGVPTFTADDKPDRAGVMEGVHRMTAGLCRYNTQVEACIQRSLLCANAAREVARALSIDVDEAYFCGLLHDIGEARIYRILDELPMSQPAPVVASIIARHHARAGADVAGAWGMSPDVAAACLGHDDVAASRNAFVRAVMIADLIVAALEGKPPSDEDAEKLGWTAPEINRLADLVASQSKR